MLGAVESTKGTSRKDLSPGGTHISWEPGCRGGEPECQDTPVEEGQLLGVGLGRDSTKWSPVARVTEASAWSFSYRNQVNWNE